MADTMKFGPEWLRALSDGPLSASSATTKFKLAEHRYGLEEMLALYQETFEPPEHLSNFRSIFVEEAQKPLALLPPSEEEQRIIAQGVNSTLVTRGRGGVAALRGGRGANIDRSRGRGRGRGDVYPTRNSLENGDIGGGFGRPRGPNKDGWEEVGRKLDRNYPRPYDEVASGGNPRFNRSISDNWRDKGAGDDDEEGDWRKAGRDKWIGHRSSWREPGKGVSEADRRNGGISRGRGFNTDERGRKPDSWESEDVPEWAEDGSDEMGSFDGGAFVSNREHQANKEINKGSQSREHLEETTAQTMIKSQNKKENDSCTKEEAAVKKSSITDRAAPLNGLAESPRKFKDLNTPLSISETQPTSAPPQHTEAVSMPLEVTAANTGGEEAVHEPAQDLAVLLTDALGEKPEESTELAPGDEEALKWFYTDPQGEMQGPFSAEEMAQWFSAGYFTMNLLVKRRCDQQFQPLGELIKRWGRVPFLPGAAPPPVVHSPLVISEPTETVAQPLPLHLPEITSMAPLQPALPVVTSTHTSNLTLPQGPGIGPDQLLVQQHLLLRNQLLQQQLVRQIQMQALAQLQLQEQEGFKTLDPVQQQHLNLQILQSHPLLLHQVQQLQQAQQLQVSQGQPQATIPVQPISQHVHSQQPSTDMDLSLPSPSFQRSISQPAASTERQGDMTSIWGTVSTAGAWSQPGSVWDLENDGASSLPKADIADIEKLRQEKETELARLAEEERRRQEEIQKQQEELRRQQEELQREREQVLREKEELERQKQMELQRLEEARRQHEERQRLEEVRRQHEEEQKRRELEEAEKRRWAEEEEKKRLHEEQRRKEEEKKRLEEVRWQEDKRKQEELRRKADEELALQELKRQEEMRQQEEAERQRQQMEIQKKQQEFQKQQQEALRRLQQQQREQLADIQLPPTANWARQQQQAGGPQQSLTEIQQEEQKRQQQLELKRQQMLRLQAEQLAQQQLQHQHQQQQQKSWASSAAVPQSARIKTLAEIQEEQAKQLQEEQEKITQQQQHHQQQQQQQQQQQTKNMGLSMAAVWGSGEPKFNLGSAAWGGGSVWGSETSMSLWGSSYNSTQPTPVSSNASVAKKSGKESTSQSSDFPALINRKSSSKSQSNNKPQPTKAMKEEEAVQRLFQQPAQKKDDFTVWCEAFLQGMDVTVDIETFVSFLQAVESPYEVHDYVRNYLGEGKDAKEFAKQFLEKRSQFKNKARMEKRQEEESIWGPAPAVTPREARRLPQQAPLEQNHGDGSKAKNKKKKKMQKMDGSNLLSFTVEKDPNRKNAGEIASLD